MTRRLYSKRQLSELRKSNNRVWGIAGASLQQNKKSPDIGNAKGAYGEELVGSLINLLASETQNFYAIHSTYDEETQIENDHVIVYKNKILLIETKTYSRYDDYHISKTGVLTAKASNAKKRRVVPDSSIFNKVQHYQNLFPEATVKGIIIITRDCINTHSENGIYKVASLQDSISIISQELKTATPRSTSTVWTWVKHFAVNCVKPAPRTPPAPVNASMSQNKTILTNPVDISRRRQRAMRQYG